LRIYKAKASTKQTYTSVVSAGLSKVRVSDPMLDISKTSILVVTPEDATVRFISSREIGMHSLKSLNHLIAI